MSLISIFERLAGHRQARLLAPLFIVVLCALVYLPGLTTLPPFDRDESRYAQASKQMIETGDYTNIQFQNTPRHKKPVGIYWLQSLSVRALDQARSFHISYFRIPSLVAAITAALLFFFLTSNIIGRSAALFATTILCTSLTAVAEAHLATTDSTLLLCAVATMGVLMRAWNTQKDVYLPLSTLLIFWLGMAGGILTKGPVLPAVVIMGSLTYSITTRSIGWVKKLGVWWGIPLCVALILPWFLSIQSQTGGAFLTNSFKGDIAPKLVGVHESHRGFPGFYSLTAFVSFWPWSFLLIPSVVYAYKNRQDKALLPWLCWLVPSWIALEIVPTKLPHYSLPLFPALAVVCVHYVLASVRPLSRAARSSQWAATAISLVLGAILIGAPIYFSGSAPLLSISGGIVVVAATLLGSQFDRLPLIQACIFFPTLFFSTLPNLGPFWSSRVLSEVVAHVGDQIREHSGPATTVHVASAGYGEPSFVFLNGTDTLLTDGAGAATFINSTCNSVALVAKREVETFSSTLRGLGREATLSEPVSVFNYSKGKWLEVRSMVRVGCE